MRPYILFILFNPGFNNEDVTFLGFAECHYLCYDMKFIKTRQLTYRGDEDLNFKPLSDPQSLFNENITRYGNIKVLFVGEKGENSTLKLCILGG